MDSVELKKLIESETNKFWENDDRDQLPDILVDRPLGSYCDHTVLRAYTKRKIIKEFCDEAKKYGAASVAVNPSNIKFVSEELKGTGVLVGAAIGFPLGATTSAVKAFEAAEAIDNGAGEVDMVINIGALKDADYFYVYQDIKDVITAVNGKDNSVPVKVILETCYLTDNEKIAACVIAREAGADFIKTSTGMGTGGAKIADIKLIRKVVGESMQIKASADILIQEDVIAMVKAGATRVGISRIVQIVTGDNDVDCASKHNKAF